MAQLLSFALRTILQIHNFVCLFGWTYVLLVTLHFLLYSPEELDKLIQIKEALAFFQSLAIMDIAFCFLKLSKANPLNTLFQVLGRLIILFLAVIQIHDWRYFVVAIPWSLSEMIRFFYYLNMQMKLKKEVFEWLRYSAFIVLYPIGYGGEILCSIERKKQLMSSGNTRDYTLCQIYPFVSFPFFAFLYFRMLQQRSKHLGENKLKSD